jgi:hypothetical protein
MSSLSRLKPLIPVLVLGAIALAYWMLLISPKRAEVAALDAKLATASTLLQQTEATAASYELARAAYPGNYAKLVRLGKAVPNDDNVRTLLVELQDTAHRSGVTFRSLNLGNGSTTPAAPGTAPATVPTEVVPGATPVSGTDLSALDFDLGFDGSYFNTSNLLTRLERYVTVQNKKLAVTGRLLRIESIDLQPSGENFKQMTAKIKARAYLIPEIKPVGDTSATPGTAATPAGTTAPAAAPTTTASISTGVNR